MDISSIFDKVRPLSQRPPKLDRTRSRFGASYSSTLRTLATEFNQHGAKPGTRVLEMDLEPSRIRLDGFPYANAVPATAYVAVRFETFDGRTIFMDGGQYGDWRDNLRAIALSLEALRKVERYGVAHGRQYAGFLPPSAGAAIHYSPGDAAEVVGALAARSASASSVPDNLAILQDPDAFQDAKRKAVKAVHPDMGGDPEDWARLSAALRSLEEHHA